MRDALADGRRAGVTGQLKMNAKRNVDKPAVIQEVTFVDGEVKFVYKTTINPNYVDTFLQQLINGLSLGAIYALIALGYTMVYGVLRLINFAHGDVYMLGAFAGYYLANALEPRRQPVDSRRHRRDDRARWRSAPASASLIERFAYRPVRHHSRLTSLITAIGVSLLLEYGGQVVFGATPRFFPQMIRSETYSLGGVQITNQSLLIIVVAVVVMFGLEFIVHRTKIGKAMRATSFNLSVAQADGHQHRLRDRVHLRAGLGARGGRRRDGGAGDSAHRSADGADDRPEGVRRGGARRHRQHSRRDARRHADRADGDLDLSATAYSTYRDAVAFAVLILILLFRPAGILGHVRDREGLAPHEPGPKARGHRRHGRASCSS